MLYFASVKIHFTLISSFLLVSSLSEIDKTVSVYVQNAIWAKAYEKCVKMYSDVKMRWKSFAIRERKNAMNYFKSLNFSLLKM